MKKLKFLLILISMCFISGCSQDTTYTVNFISNVDYSIENIIVIENETITLPDDPYIEGYRFIGWFLEDTQFDDNTKITSDITISVQFVKLYFITYQLNNNTNWDIQGYQENEVILLPTPAREGYMFSHWENNNEEFTHEYMPTENFILTAVWIKTWNINFESGFSELELGTISGLYNSDIEFPYLIEYNGYLFQGWSLNGELWNETKFPEEDITLTAVWTDLNSNYFSTMYINLFDANGDIYTLNDVNRVDYISSMIAIEEENKINYLTASFRGRGNGSWSEPKKGYKLKFDTEITLLNDYKSKHYTLISCMSGEDTTMFRNYFAYDLADNYFSNLEYVIDKKLIELYVNNTYHGMYLLCEHIRIDENRVDLSHDLNDLDSDYFLEYDVYCTGEENIDYFRINGVKYGFTVAYPTLEDYENLGKTKDDLKESILWIKEQTQNLYDAALTFDYVEFNKLADVDSFVDMYILHELFKNTDTGWSSFYISKKANDKFYLTCPWDFDITVGSSRGDSSSDGIYVAGSIIENSDFTSSELFISLYQTNEFLNLVIQRWSKLSSDLYTYFSSYNEDYLEQMKEQMGRNYYKWYEAESIEIAENIWMEDTLGIIEWLKNRIIWLDDEWNMED